MSIPWWMLVLMVLGLAGIIAPDVHKYLPVRRRQCSNDGKSNSCDIYLHMSRDCYALSRFSAFNYSSFLITDPAQSLCSGQP